MYMYTQYVADFMCTFWENTVLKYSIKVVGCSCFIVSINSSFTLLALGASSNSLCSNFN